MRIALATALCLLPPAGPASDDAGKDQAPWEEQLAEFGFQIIHLSTINAVNGLNLDVAQVRKLREMAERVEKAGAAPPAPKGSFLKELEEPRAVYRELHDVILRGEQVSDQLRARVAKARAAESRILRETLRPPRRGYDRTSCLRCHASPGEGQTATPFQSWARSEVSSAHSLGLYGWRGLVLVWTMAPRVDAVLTDAQRAVFSDFSCCLVPPSNLADPVRVGQADAPEWADDLLRRARKIPERMWPAARDRMADFFAGLEDARRPGATEADRESARARFRKVMDEARALSETDFELSCAELAAKLSAGPKAEDHRIKRAYFLLSPGSTEIYDELIRRLERKPQIPVPRADLEAEKPACRMRPPPPPQEP